MSEPSTSPSLLVALVDLTGGNEGAAFLKRAPVDNSVIRWWELLFQSQGKVTRRLGDITEIEPLQYLIWNTTKTPPPDDLETAKAQCAALANNLEVDQTTVDMIKSQISPEFLATLNAEGEKTMAQGSATEGALEKPGKKGSKKSGKKKAAVTDNPPADNAPADGQAAAPAAKKEKDPTGRPGEGTQTRKVWDIADSLAAANNNVTPTRAAVIEAAVKAGVNKATAGVQYGHWFKGMKRTPPPEPVKPEAPAETAATTTAAAS